MKNVKFGLVAVGLLVASMANAQGDKGHHNGDTKFEKMDANADGKVSKEEFIAAKEKLDKKREEKGKEHKEMDVDKRFNKLDRDGDGNIDKAEFDQAQAERAEKAAERRDKFFAKIDTDGNGTVNREEFDAHHEVMEAKRKEKHPDSKPVDADKKFKKLDANADGVIDKAEFENAHQHRNNKKAQGKKVK